MSQTGRLSTCGRCGGTIEWEDASESASGRTEGAGWGHVLDPRFPHWPEPDDGYVSGPDDDEEEE